MRIKEKIANIDEIILKKDFLQKLIKLSGRKYEIDDLVTLWYISVIKKWETYYNNMIKSFKNPYIIWWAYMNFEDFMFGWPDRYNKEWFTTQVSNIFTIYNLKYSRELEILGIKFKFKKIKKEFLYSLKSTNIDDKKISFMTRERLFLEYIRDYIKYDDDFFIEAYKTLDIKRLDKTAQKYPIKQVVLKLNNIKQCI